MLEEKIDISEWVNKKLNKQKQVEFIIKNAHNINNTCLTILQNYLDDLKIERDTMS